MEEGTIVEMANHIIARHKPNPWSLTIIAETGPTIQSEA
jgi:hypothetical protein